MKPHNVCVVLFIIDHLRAFENLYVAFLYNHVFVFPVVQIFGRIIGGPARRPVMLPIPEKVFKESAYTILPPWQSMGLPSSASQSSPGLNEVKTFRRCAKAMVHTKTSKERIGLKAPADRSPMFSVHSFLSIAYT